MIRTRNSSKGQIVIPKAIRDRNGVKIAPTVPRPKTLTVDEVFGCLKHKGKPSPIVRLAAPVKLGKNKIR